MCGKQEQLYDDNAMLISLAQSGDEAALERLISQNMGLVKNIAKRFVGRGAEFEDLVQIGSIGMLKAAKSFDSSYGTVFSTYAVPLIIGEIRRFLRDDGIIKVSRDIRRRGSEIMRAKEKFIAENDREPKISELSAICGISPEDIVYALDAVCPVYSLQDTLGNDDDGATLEAVTPSAENEIERATDKLALKEAISKLDEQSRSIIMLRYYRELSQQQTAQRRARGYLQAQEAAQLVLAVLPDRMGLQVGAHPHRPLHHIQGPLLRVCLLLLHHAVDIPHYEHPLPHHQLAPALALQALARSL